jgi:tetrahydrodipicolinate N-succinyltransferase
MADPNDPLYTLVAKAETRLSQARTILAKLEGELRTKGYELEQSSNYKWLANAVWTLNGTIEADKLNALASQTMSRDVDRAIAYNKAIDDCEAASQSAEGEIAVLDQAP